MPDTADIEVIVDGAAYFGWLDYKSKHSFDKCAGTLRGKVVEPRGYRAGCSPGQSTPPATAAGG